MLSCGVAAAPPAFDAMNAWLWDGICCVVSVTVSTPPLSPTVYCEVPEPWPWWIGIRPWRSGRPKVSWPSPPYVVPIRLNSTSFSEIGMSCPAHIAQPAGAKLPANILISATYGCAMAVLPRPDALERDAPAQYEVRLQVSVRLAAADERDGGGVQVRDVRR